MAGAETVSMAPPTPVVEVSKPPPQHGAAGGEMGATRSMQLPRALSFLEQAAHPITCVFHALFKILVLLVYINGRYIAGSYVPTFIFVTVFAALDFWTVKNITGRMLVGLRWWNHVREDGSSEWVFESNPEESHVNAMDRRVFWSLIYIWPLLWGVFLLTNVLNFSFNWVLLNGMTLTFAMANFAGYWKCSKDAKKRARDWVEQQGLRAVVSGLGF